MQNRNVKKPSPTNGGRLEKAPAWRSVPANSASLEKCRGARLIGSVPKTPAGGSAPALPLLDDLNPSIRFYPSRFSISLASVYTSRSISRWLGPSIITRTRGSVPLARITSRPFSLYFSSSWAI